MPDDRLFLDTSFVIARFNRRDRYHAAAQALARSVPTCREVWTTEAVLLEVANSFLEPGRREIAIRVWDQAQKDARFHVAAISGSLLKTGISLFRKRSDKSWSLTDCISFAVMEAEQLTDALTADQHFVQAGFRALLLEAR